MENGAMQNNRRCDNHYVDNELQASIVFLSNLIQKIIESTRNIDIHCNVLIGFSTGVFILSMNEMIQAEQYRLTLTILAVFSALSAISALCAIRPLRFMVKKGQEESLLYARKIASFPSAKEYSKELIKVLENDDEIFYQYSIEVYNLSKYYYQPKRRFFSISRNIFLLGIAIGLIMLLVESAIF